MAQVHKNRSYENVEESMWEWLTGIAYYAHGYCLSWDPWLIAAHAGSDFLIFGAYTAIPIAILIFVHRRPQLEMKGLARFFAAFIFWCGLTHLSSMITLWQPIYDIQAVVKIITAAISIPTAILIFFLIPQALAIPSPSELQLANQRLQSEVSAHNLTLHDLRQIQLELEDKVRDRTKSLEDAAAQSKALVREVAHRAGNLMAVIAAMARLSGKGATDTEQFAADLAGRIDGLGRSHQLLFKAMWGDVDLEHLVCDQVTPFVIGQRVEVSGPAVLVAPSVAHYVGMVFHELATNSIKHGALSLPAGKVLVDWSIEGEDPSVLILEWREEGGPPTSRPSHQGWGTTVTQRMAIEPLQGKVELDYAAAGLRWRLTAPLVDGRLGRKQALVQSPD
jgi:two-component sensor histidine kinase